MINTNIKSSCRKVNALKNTHQLVLPILCVTAQTSVKEMFCHLADNVENYIFRGTGYISFGILELRVARSESTDEISGLQDCTVC